MSRNNPKTAKEYTERAIISLVKKDFDSAIHDYDKAICLDPNLAEARKDRGYAWFGKGEYSKALIDFNEAIRLNPNDQITIHIRDLVRMALERGWKH